MSTNEPRTEILLEKVANGTTSSWYIGLKVRPFSVNILTFTLVRLVKTCLSVSVQKHPEQKTITSSQSGFGGAVSTEGYDV